MIKLLKMRNFRKHTDTVIEFGPGLVAIRGGNEQGKSTVFEAIAYALFGVSACRQPLEGVVTWGQPVKSLAVELIIEFEGEPYLITRSSAGAEVNHSGGKVTGQKETVRFLSDLMGINATTASRLMLAEQGQIRGALSAGAKATMELIEQLANFDMLDTVIERIQEGLPVGNTGALEDRISTLEKQVAEAADRAVKPDVAAYERNIAGYEAGITLLQAEIEQHQPMRAVLRGQANARLTLRAQLAECEKRIEQVASRAAGLEPLIASAKAEADAETFEKDLPGLRQELLSIERAEADSKLYLDLEKAAKLRPENEWDEPLASLGTAITNHEVAVNNETTHLSNLAADIRVLETQRITSSVCGFCNQDVSQFPDVALKNAKIEEDLSIARAAVATHQKLKNETLQNLNDLRQIWNYQRGTVEPLIARGGDKLVVDQSVVPYRLSPKTPLTKNLRTTARVNEEIARIEDRVRKASAAAVKHTMLSAELVALNTDTTALLNRRLEINSCLSAVLFVDEELEQVETKISKAEAERSDLRSLADTEAMALRGVQAAYLEQVRSLEHAQWWLKNARTELAAVEKGNALLKRVRVARPKIADHLWSVVLSSVSVYFTQMRGEQSNVTKDKDGFKVNGQAVEGLSGSAGDLLGLAIRFALTRTFLPETGFMMLDEPAAACSAERTEALLGFLVSSGYPQTLLVTHESASEAVADQLVMI